MTQYLTESGMGERYDHYRPKIHQAVVQKMHQHVQDRHFERVVDVACGTGDSTILLLELGQDVMGIDSSDEMLAIARKRGLCARRADYTELSKQGRFDLISTCMAFHWLDGAQAIAAYRAASNRRGLSGLSIILPSRAILVLMSLLTGFITSIGSATYHRRVIGFKTLP